MHCRNYNVDSANDVPIFLGYHFHTRSLEQRKRHCGRQAFNPVAKPEPIMVAGVQRRATVSQARPDHREVDMATLTVGSGSGFDHSTLAAAIAISNDGDLIQ